MIYQGHVPIYLLYTIFSVYKQEIQTPKKLDVAQYRTNDLRHTRQLPSPLCYQREYKGELVASYTAAKLPVG